jgi:hypothetical protein
MSNALVIAARMGAASHRRGADIPGASHRR